MKKNAQLILVGGLGNQIYEIIFARFLKDKFNFEIELNEFHRADHHPYAGGGIFDFNIENIMCFKKITKSRSLYSKVQISLALRYFKSNLIALKFLGVINDEILKKYELNDLARFYRFRIFRNFKLIGYFQDFKYFNEFEKFR